MKQYKNLLLLILPLVLSGCGSNPTPSSENTSEDPSTPSETTTSEDKGPEPVKKYVEAEMVSNLNKSQGKLTYKDTCYYDDTWFYKDSSELNYDLATMSAMASATTHCEGSDRYGARTKDLMNQMGYTNIGLNTYFNSGIFLENSMGVAIGSKTLVDDKNKEFTLLSVFTRSAGYEAEWVGNFELGKEGIHEGFLQCRDEVLRYMKSYIAANSITGDLKVWIAGYSRGAATANLVAGFLDEGSNYFGDTVSIKKEDIYTYLIAVPEILPESVLKKDVLTVSGPRGNGYLDTNVPLYVSEAEGTINPADAKYNNIFNFVAKGDFVTKLPPVQWGFTRYGVTNTVDFGDEKFVSFLNELSPETADIFKDKNYSTQVSKKTFDLKTFEIIDTNEKVSADELINQRFEALIKVSGSREGLVEKGYSDFLGNVTAIFGTDWQGFLGGITADIMSIVKAGVLAYFAYIMETYGLEQNEAVAEFATGLMVLAGKHDASQEAYTDQEFLADLFDFLINDYKTDENAKKRVQTIAGLLPEMVRPIVTDLFEYAALWEFDIKTFDDLLYLLAAYITDNIDNPLVLIVVSLLSSFIPDDYVDLLAGFTFKEYPEEDYPTIEDKKRGVLINLLANMAYGAYDTYGELVAEANLYRGTLVSLVAGFALADYPTLQNLIVNGLYVNADTEDGKNHSEPAPLKDLVNDILKLALPKNEAGESLSIIECANNALVELLLKGRTNTNGVYVDRIAANPDAARRVLTALVFAPGETYNLGKDVENALTAVNVLSFLYPVHYAELYISYLKTKVSWQKN